MTTPLAERRWIGWAIAALVVAVYLPTLAFGFIGYDDHWLWSDDSPLRALDGETLKHIWLELDARSRHDIGTEYLPVRDMLVALDMTFWRTSEHGPHITQLGLYALTVVGLGNLLVRFHMRRDLAWLATLLWALHPLHVESVAWLSERKGILAGLFVVATGHAWVRYRASLRARWLVVAAACAVAGTWSKAPAMFAPAIFAIWDVLLIPEPRRRLRTIVVVNAAAILAAIPVIIVALGGGIVDGEFSPPPDGRITACVGALGHYALGILGVRAPAIAYPIQTSGAAGFELALGAAVIAATLALAAWRGEGRRWRLATLAWAALAYLPISHLVTRVHIAVADRYVYLLLLAPCIGAAWLALRLRGIVRTLAIAGLALALALATLRAQKPWSSSESLYERALRSSPGDSGAALSLAELLYTRNDAPAALAVVERSLRSSPSDPYLIGRRAELLEHLGRVPEALEAARRAAESGHASLTWRYAQLLARHGDPARALAFAEHAAQRRPEVPQYAWTRIQILVALGQLDDAQRAGEALVLAHPGSASHLVLARVLDARGDHGAAEAQRAIAASVYGVIEVGR